MKGCRRTLALIISGVLFSLPAALARNDANPLTEGMGAAVTRAVLVLFLILALIFFLVFLIRKYLPGLVSQSPGRLREGGKIEILEVKAVAPRRSVILLRMGQHEVLIGSHEQGLTSLAVWKSGSGGSVAAETTDPAFSPTDLK